MLYDPSTTEPLHTPFPLIPTPALSPDLNSVPAYVLGAPFGSPSYLSAHGLCLIVSLALRRQVWGFFGLCFPSCLQHLVAGIEYKFSTLCLNNEVMFKWRPVQAKYSMREKQVEQRDIKLRLRLNGAHCSWATENEGKSAAWWGSREVGRASQGLKSELRPLTCHQRVLSRVIILPFCTGPLLMPPHEGRWSFKPEVTLNVIMASWVYCSKLLRSFWAFFLPSSLASLAICGNRRGPTYQEISEKTKSAQFHRAPTTTQVLAPVALGIPTVDVWDYNPDL